MHGRRGAHVNDDSRWRVGAGAAGGAPVQFVGVVWCVLYVLFWESGCFSESGAQMSLVVPISGPNHAWKILLAIREKKRVCSEFCLKSHTCMTVLFKHWLSTVSLFWTYWMKTKFPTWKWPHSSCVHPNSQKTITSTEILPVGPLWLCRKCQVRSHMVGFYGLFGA